jgi:hypothetical protein
MVNLVFAIDMEKRENEISPNWRSFVGKQKPIFSTATPQNNFKYCFHSNQILKEFGSTLASKLM